MLANSLPLSLEKAEEGKLDLRLSKGVGGGSKLSELFGFVQLRFSSLEAAVTYADGLVSDSNLEAVWLLRRQKRKKNAAPAARRRSTTTIGATIAAIGVEWDFEMSVAMWAVLLVFDFKDKEVPAGGETGGGGGKGERPRTR